MSLCCCCCVKRLARLQPTIQQYNMRDTPDGASVTGGWNSQQLSSHPPGIKQTLGNLANSRGGLPHPRVTTRSRFQSSFYVHDFCLSFSNIAPCILYSLFFLVITLDSLIFRDVFSSVLSNNIFFSHASYFRKL